VYCGETWPAPRAEKSSSLGSRRATVAPTSSLIYKVLLAFVDKALTVCAAVFTGFNDSVVKNFFIYICQLPFHYHE
jgi:hypothetical protein